jgi:hypothetical protein
MSVDIRVELPAFAHSFDIPDVPLSSTILDVKGRIFHLCIGAPRVEGQRLIFRGRCLADHEKVEHIQSPDSGLILHLAVHPSAWTKLLPSPQLPLPAPVNTNMQIPLPAAVTGSHPLAYVLYIHQNALIALMQGTIVQPRDLNELNHSKILSIQHLEKHGWQWPSILDEAFPPSSQGGLKYDRINIECAVSSQLRLLSDRLAEDSYI